MKKRLKILLIAVAGLALLWLAVLGIHKIVYPGDEL